MGFTVDYGRLDSAGQMVVVPQTRMGKCRVIGVIIKADKIRFG